MKATITLFSAMLLATSLSFGQDGPPAGGAEAPRKAPEPEKIFKKLDANSDNLLSLDEFKASPIGKKDATKAEEIYKKIDADSNNEVTLDEFKAHGPGKGKGEKGKGEKGKGKGKGKDAPADAPAAE